MGRKKIEIKPITEDRNRQVTLTKRKFGVFKKAHELAVLTKSDVALIIFDSQNRLYQYSSKPMKDILTRIIENPNPTEIHNKESMVALIKKKKKSGDKDDEHETDDEAESAHEAAHPPGPAAAAAAAAALPAAAAMRVETQGAVAPASSRPRAHATGHAAPRRECGAGCGGQCGPGAPALLWRPRRAHVSSLAWLGWTGVRRRYRAP